MTLFIHVNNGDFIITPACIHAKYNVSIHINLNDTKLYRSFHIYIYI